MDNKNSSFFNNENELFPLGIIGLESAKDLSIQIKDHLVNWLVEENPENANQIKKDGDSLLIDNTCPRFYTGDAKGVLGQTVRGYDLYIIVDVGNYNCKFTMFGNENCMSPDDHYADLKRIISAIGGKAHRINVIMPILYGGRQHKRSSRESLDCAMALHELMNMGVENIITFDAHDPRVQNAIPLTGFDNVMPTYQVLKALLKHAPDLKLDNDNLMIVSPDEGAMNRNIYYSSVLGIDLGMFYKRRDYSKLENGRNPIVAHEYLGSSVEGKDILVSDDVIASGDSILSLAYELKKGGARRIFASATYALFTEGLEKFNKAYADGVIAGVLSTNLTYQPPQLQAAPWFINVDCSKYIAYFIAALHKNHSITTILEPHIKINALLAEYNKNLKGTSFEQQTLTNDKK